jgi:hypothetical protein
VASLFTRALYQLGPEAGSRGRAARAAGDTRRTFGNPVHADPLSRLALGKTTGGAAVRRSARLGCPMPVLGGRDSHGAPWERTWFATSSPKLREIRPCEPPLQSHSAGSVPPPWVALDTRPDSSRQARARHMIAAASKIRAGGMGSTASDPLRLEGRAPRAPPRTSTASRSSASTEPVHRNPKRALRPDVFRSTSTCDSLF